MRLRKSYRDFGLILAVCLLSLLCQGIGVFTYWDRVLGDARMAVSSKPFTNDIVFVAVDARSLGDVGAWPWSRAVHAGLLNRITEGGARDVLLDFDFAFPSDLEGDLAFRDALERAGGATYLAVFEQHANITDPNSLHFNAPLSTFSDASWPALVNVIPDRNGLVRSYPFAAEHDGTFIMSAGALLSGATEAPYASFEIDYSLDPKTVMTVSAVDVLNGEVAEDVFRQKIVIVGASAIELSDQLAVPVHGIIPGPLIHALATETLSRDLALKTVRSGWIVSGMLGMLLILGAVFAGSPVSRLVTTFAVLGVIEVAALSLFRTSSVMVPTAILYPAMLGLALWSVVRKLVENTWLLAKTTTQARNTLHLLERIFDDGSDGIVVLGSDGRVIRQSAAALQMLGAGGDGDVILPARLARIALAEHVSALKKQTSGQYIEIVVGGERKTLEYQATRSFIERPGHLSNSSPHERITTLVLRDLTKLREQERDIAYLSSYDERTGALRRNTFLTFLQLRLEGCSNTAVFVLTLDRFKTVNVTLGREVGDAILSELVHRLEGLPLELSAAARLGGTSFAFFAESPTTKKDGERIANAVLEEISGTYRLETANADVTGRIGYACISSESGISAELALEQAEDALDAAKSMNLGIVHYDASAGSKQKRGRTLERAMEAALSNDEFHLLYQPQYRVSDGALVGAEALIRWESPTHGKVSPEEFIGIAESTGFIVELGKWALGRAAFDTQRLPPEVIMAVNVSGTQILRSDLVSDVRAVLADAGLPAQRICLELTESVFLASNNTIIETMLDLSFLGVTWALDDFGTGFSSMAYLSKMPLDKVKLDKSFVMNLGEDPTARPIVHSTAELCRGLGVKLLCEGVETERQLAILAEEDCDEAQGYLFSKPVPINQLLHLAEAASPDLDKTRLPKRGNKPPSM